MEEKLSEIREEDVTLYTIMQWLNWRNFDRMGVQFMRLSDKELRLHKDNRNLDIFYDEGVDLYIVKKHIIDRETLEVKTKEIKDVFGEDLKEIAWDFLIKKKGLEEAKAMKSKSLYEYIKENAELQKLIDKWHKLGIEAGKNDDWMDVENTIKDTYEEEKFEDSYDLVYTDLERWEETDHFYIKYASKMGKDCKALTDDFDEQIEFLSEIKNAFWEGFFEGRRSLGIDIFKIAEELIEKGKVEEKKEIKEAEEVSTKEVGAEESKEYFGKAKDQYYYFVKRGSKYAIQDATGNDVLTSEEGETLEQFLIDAIRDLDLEDIAYEIVDKYLLPKEEPKEEEKPEEEKPEEEEKPKAERPEEGPKEEKPEEGTEEIKPEEPKPEEPEAEEPKEPVESIQKKKVSDFTDVEEREEPADREEFKITGEELRNYWATGKPLIVGDKEYSVHRMSYGDYFLEPFGKERGETEGFAPGTIWLKKIDSQKDIYGILEKRVGREEESIEEVGKEEKSKGTQASASGEYGIAVSDIAKEVFKVAEDTDVFELLDSKAVYDYIRKQIEKDIAKKGAKNVSVVDVEFAGADSSNILHAFSYYSVTLNGPKEELDKVVGEDKIIIGEVSEQVCPGSKIRSRGKGRGLGRGRGRGPIGIPISKKRVSEAEEDIEEVSMSTEDIINMAVKAGWNWREFVERIPDLNTEEVKEIFRRKGGKVDESKEIIADENIAGKEYYDAPMYIRLGERVWVAESKGEKLFFKDKDRAERFVVEGK